MTLNANWRDQGVSPQHEASWIGYAFDAQNQAAPDWRSSLDRRSLIMMNGCRAKQRAFLGEEASFLPVLTCEGA
jgi:hypothetical protein